MNWKKIVAYAATLFVAQVMVGFLEGSFARVGSSIALSLVGYAASFVVCGSIFAHLAAHQPAKPFAHSFAALALQVAVSAVLAQALTGWLGSMPLVLVALQWLVLICALLAGTAVGSSLRRGARQPADA